MSEMESPAADSASAHPGKRNLWKSVTSGIRATRTFTLASPYAQGAGTPLFTAASQDGRVALHRLQAVRNQSEAASRELQDLVTASEQFTTALRRTQETMRSMLDDHDVQSLVGTPAFYAIHDAHESLITLVQGAGQHARETLGIFQQQIDPAIQSAEDSRRKMYEAFTLREQLATTVDNLSRTSKLDSQMKAVQLTNEHRDAASSFAQHQADTVTSVRSVCAEVRVTLAQSLVRTVTAESREVTASAKCLRVAADLAAVAPVPRAGAAAVHFSPLEATAASLSLSPSRPVSGRFSRDGSVSAALRPAKAPQDDMLPLSATPMLPGESLISRLEQIVDSARGVPGVLVTTNYRLRWFPAGFQSWSAGQVADIQGSALRPRAPSTFDVSSLAVLEVRGGVGASTSVRTHYSPAPYLSIPLLSIARMEARREAGSGQRGSLVLGCTDMRVVTLSFALADVDPDMVQILLADHVWVKEPVFCRTYAAAVRAALGPQKPLVDGWAVYDVRREFDRCFSAYKFTTPARIAVSTVNTGYKMCGSYPEVLIMPTAIGESSIQSAAKFRSKRRLPAVTWFRGSVTLSRASQPMAGMFSARSAEDEKVVLALSSVSAASEGGHTHTDATTHSPTRAPGLAIFDARPRLNAAANAAKGGGSETIGNYPGCTLDFLNIDNIHVVRDALAGLRGHVLRETRYALHAQLEASHVPLPSADGLLAQVADWTIDYSAIVGVNLRPESVALDGMGASGIGRTLSLADPDDIDGYRGGRFGGSFSGVIGGGGTPGGGYGRSASYAEGTGTPTVLGTPSGLTSHLGSSLASDQDRERGGGVMGLAMYDDEDEDGGEGETGEDREQQDGYRGESAAEAARNLAASLEYAAPPSNSSHPPPTPTPASDGAARRERIRAMGGLSPPTPHPASVPFPGQAQATHDKEKGKRRGSRAGAMLSGLLATTRRLLKFKRRGPSTHPDGQRGGGGTGVSGDNTLVVGSGILPGAGQVGGVGVTSRFRFDTTKGGSVVSAGGGEGADLPPTQGRRGSSAGVGGPADGAGVEALVRAGGGGGKHSRVLPWLKLCSIQLEGGLRLARKLAGGTSVLVHCSDGWDRTSALTSLAQLMLDPHVRTLYGFAVLIEKEWVSFGHRFGRRNGTGGVGHDRADSVDGQRAPIFVQWLDCVWQMVRQCPQAYEFNEALLVALAEHAYSARFGTFLLDCERHRVESKLRDSTLSVWGHLLGENTRSEYTNPSYDPATAVPLTLPLPGASLGLVPVMPLTDVASLAVWPYWSVKWTAC